METGLWDFWAMWASQLVVGRAALGFCHPMLTVTAQGEAHAPPPVPLALPQSPDSKLFWAGAALSRGRPCL